MKIILTNGDARTDAKTIAQKQIEIIRKCTNIYLPDTLHDLRVSLRRLRNAFMLFDKCYLDSKKGEKTAYSLAKEVQRLRDIDVQIEIFKSLKGREEGLDFLLDSIIDKIESERLLELKDVEWAFRYDFQRIVDKLTYCSTTNYASYSTLEISYPFLKERISVFRERLPLAKLEVASCAQHKLRISIKHLRYTLETLQECGRLSGIESLLKCAKKVQDYLGEIHDLDVAMVRLKNLSFSNMKNKNAKKLFFLLREERRKRYFMFESKVNDLEKGIEKIEYAFEDLNFKV